MAPRMHYHLPSKLGTAIVIADGSELFNSRGREMKSERELLTDFMQMVGKYSSCFFKLKNGEDCFGEIELVNDNFIQFYPDWDEALKDYDYEIHYEQDEFEREEPLQFILIPLQDIDTSNLYYWWKDCFINPQWSVAQQCWVHNETIPGSIPLPTYILDPMKDNKCRKKVGYWQSYEWQPYYPHPKHLVEPGWRESERSKIIAYLKSGHGCGHWCGYSYCRFGCFSQRPEKNASKLEHRERMDGIKSMGCRDLTDGEWVWPEGLAHYVEKHNICLPDAFIETMQKNSWLIPPKVDFQHFREVGVSSSYWINWAIKYVRTKQVLASTMEL